MEPPLLAHAGHWVIYTLPVLVVSAAVVAGAIRERRGREANTDPEADDGEG